MRVDWTPRAIRLLGGIQAHLERYSTARAAREAVRILLRSTRRLDPLPRSSRMVPEWGIDQLREIIVEKRYRVLYRIWPDRIEVLAVIDTRQNPELIEKYKPRDL